MLARPTLTRALLCAALLPHTFALSSAAPQRVGCIWDREADSPIARFEAGTLPIDGQLYCFGGFFNQAIQATSRSDKYDPQTDTWTQISDLPTPVTHSAFAREGRNVWLLGGFVGDNPGVATAEVWRYDIDQDVWVFVNSLPRAIAAGGAAILGRNMHYFGGCEADRDTMTGDHWVMDLDNTGLGWTALASMPEPRCHLSGAALGGEVWAVGGQLRHDTNPLDTRWVHRYDPIGDVWTQGPLLPEPRSHFEPGTFVDSGNLYIAAGKDLTAGRTILGGMLELDPVLGVWSFLPPLPNPRYGAGVQKIGTKLYAANGAAVNNNPRPDLYSRDFAATFPNPFRVNCGGPEVVAASGGCWCGDIGALNGNTAHYNPNSEILNTDDDDVFDKQKQSAGATPRDIDYRLPMGDGFYRVRFFLAERGTSAPGNRVLDLFVEGERVADGLDLADDPGFQVALERGFDVQVTDGVLDIKIQAALGQRAVIAAFEVETLGPDHFEHLCTSLPNSTGVPGTLDFVGATSIGLDQLTLQANDLPNASFGLFIHSLTGGQFPLAGGILCVNQPFYRLPIEQSVGSTLTHQLQINNPPTQAQQITAGSTWHFQAWHRDTTPAGYGLTDSLKFVFTP